MDIAHELSRERCGGDLWVLAAIVFTATDAVLDFSPTVPDPIRDGDVCRRGSDVVRCFEPELDVHLVHRCRARDYFPCSRGAAGFVVLARFLAEQEISGQPIS